MPEEHRFEPLDAEAIAVGMYVRGTGRRDLHWTPTQVEGEVVQISGDGITLDGDTGGFREVAVRNWEQRLPATQSASPDGTWVDAEHGEFVVGDRVRTTGRSSGVQHEGVVTATSCNTGSGDLALVMRPDVGGDEVCRHARYRTYEKWVPAPAEAGWVSVQGSDLRVGDRARGKHLSPGDSWAEGVIRVIEDGGVRFEGNRYLYTLGREWERWTAAPTQAEPGGSWVETRAADFEVGDRVRVTHRRSGRVHVGPVTETPGWLQVSHPGMPEGESFAEKYRVFEKWVPATAPATGWVEVTNFDELNVGDTVRATPNGIGGLLQATVTSAERGSFTAHTTHVINESRNGRARDLEGWSPNGYVYGDTGGVRVWRGGGTAPAPIDTTVPEVPATPTPAPVFAAPFVGEVFTRTQNVTWDDDRPNCTVTHVARLTTPGEGWRVTYRARGVSAGEVNVLPDGTLTNTSGGRPGRYVRTTPTPHNPFAPTSIPVAPAPESGAGAERALPEWATSLDAAKRHVHAQARRLYRSGENCYRGSNDFANGLDLPTIGEDYPAPEVVDESAQIREFLTKVREVALGVARDHGKSISQVERWLREQGIVEPTPPPVQYTVTVTAPAGTTREDIINSARQLGRQGWEIN
jgi:hypothetical protein